MMMCEVKKFNVLFLPHNEFEFEFGLVPWSVAESYLGDRTAER